MREPRPSPPGRAPRPPAAWPVEGALFPPLDAAAQKALALLPQALERVWPLTGAHRRSLPDDIAALSRALTAERADLRRPYWSRPPFVSAYLYYFLPWNLVRLARLFRGLPLPPPGDAPALLLDAGSGPLTVPLALWLARPEWRGAPVRVLGLDSAAQPLELGRALFAAWGALLGEPVWPVWLERGPLESLAARGLSLARAGKGRPWLITAANVLNEVRSPRGVHGGAPFRGRDGVAAADGEGEGEDERLERLLGAWAPLLDISDGPDVPDGPVGPVGPGATDAPDADAPAAPALLFVEPGTRLGGGTLMRLRQLALEGGLAALAPCATQGTCPLARGAWCHFTFAPEGAPRWLAELSAQAGLAKRSLSLSPLLLGAPPATGENAGADPAGEGRGARLARVLSSPFAVPGVRGLARYACAPCGLALLEDAGGVASGSLVRLGAAGATGPRSRRDGRSGARIFSPPPPPAGAHAAARPGGRFKKKS